MAGLGELKRRVKVLEEAVQGEPVDRRERPKISHTDLKRLHDRLTTHEQICMPAMSRLEAGCLFKAGADFFCVSISLLRGLFFSLFSLFSYKLLGGWSSLLVFFVCSSFVGGTFKLRLLLHTPIAHAPYQCFC